ncbi:MAG: hypothetical protein L0Z52_04300 [Acidobacteria bacterium]|nr:hypothetical protein [Acidobacteriota bacterium]
MKELSRSGPDASASLIRVCSQCGIAPAPVRLPFAVGRPDSPPQKREYRVLGIGPRRKRFVQRYRWVWYILWLCRSCGSEPPTERLWNIIQTHPGTQRLVQEGYTETRLGPEFDGAEGDVTITEEPV